MYVSYRRSDKATTVDISFHKAYRRDIYIQSFFCPSIGLIHVKITKGEEKTACRRLVATLLPNPPHALVLGTEVGTDAVYLAKLIRIKNRFSDIMSRQSRIGFSLVVCHKSYLYGVVAG